jgi:hypothetical protein
MHATADIPSVPTNVAATDLDSGLTYITVTWDAVEGAESYNVYRAVWEEDAAYELAATGVTETTYDYVQTWDADVYPMIGDTPAMPPDANCDERAVFVNDLKAYHDLALPVLMSFKAPAFFKIAACNADGCSDLSAADAGKAELIHTAEYSEVAQVVIPSWGYPNLLAMADSPPGVEGLSWCGIDICGSGGGMAMGRVDLNGLPMVDMYYENFYEAWEDHPNAYFYATGWIGGRQQLIQAMQGILVVSGEFDISLGGWADVHIFVYTYIGGTSGNPNEGYASITYHGETHQFSLPVQPRDGETVADPPTPVEMDDAAHVVSTRETDYPVPFSEVPPAEDCLHCSERESMTTCDRIAEPQPVKP